MYSSWILVAVIGVAHVQAGYKVTVWTSNDWWAGTDANVYIYLYGHKGTTPKKFMDKRWYNDFERGRVDTYDITSSDYGVVRAIKIGHDNRGMGPGWKLVKVKVTDTTRGQSYYFNCNCWLEKSYRQKTLTRRVNGGWSGYGSYGSCSKSCGQGVKRRYRSCSNPSPAYGGSSCRGSTYQQTSCLVKQCPVNGGWTSFGGYSPCSKPCGGGSQSSQRSCTKPTPRYGGAYCPGTYLRTRSCNTQPCPIDGRLGAWSGYTVCTRSCGRGVQTRSRTCIAPKHGGKPCSGALSESRVCGTTQCPVDGMFSDWSDYTICTVSCGGGTQTRSRECIAPQHGGKPCNGPTTESQVCGVDPCPVDGMFSDWSDYTICTVSCGGGTQTRSRECIAPQHGGKPCNGPTTESQVCGVDPCPVDGMFSDWSDYTICTVSCGGGTQTRSRDCIAPQHGGKPCNGPTTESQVCGVDPCPVDGKFGKWSDYTICTVSCGGGTQTRSRECIAPQHGGKPCNGPTTEIQVCGVDPCPVDGKLSDWSDYTICTVSCGGGTQTRSRECIAPQHGGKPCNGPTLQSRKCSNNLCPIDGGYGQWEEYGDCSQECGGGIQTRKRSCDSPTAQHGGKECDGPSSEERPCNEQPCCATGGGIQSCAGQADGIYQLCDTCKKYIACSGGAEFIMDCGIKDPRTRASLVWNDEDKTCDFASSTCTQPEAVEQVAPEEEEQVAPEEEQVAPEQIEAQPEEQVDLTGQGRGQARSGGRGGDGGRLTKYD
ncbi:unnamed protein product [Owenia fusiformis]|uniref:Uncharacterized protein n=1 Tax=Owenia fusiformis TaxID=6347 RepID=A0A8J1XMB4_OWEFU|nr:unnamed protein product [Owenia fusiformis]